MKWFDKNIFLLSLLLFSFLLSYIYFLYFQNRQMLIANNLYNGWSVEIIEELEIDELINLLPENSRLFFELRTRFNSRVFFQNGNWRPPMIEGYFLPSKTDEFLAVVGMEHRINNEEYLVINDMRFRIIGILGTGYPSILDRMILINSFPEDLGVRRIVFDSDGIETINYFSYKVQTNTMLGINSASELLDNQYMDEQIRINVWFFSLLFIGLISLVDAVTHQKSNQVLRIVGKSRIKLFTLSMSRLVGSALLSLFLIGLIDVLLFNRLLFLVTKSSASNISCAPCGKHDYRYSCSIYFSKRRR